MADHGDAVARRQFDKWYKDNYLKIAGTSSWIERAWEAYQAGSADMRTRLEELIEPESKHSAYAAEILAAIRSLPGSPKEEK